MAVAAILAVGGLPLAAQQPGPRESGPWVFLSCDYPDVPADLADQMRDLLDRPGGLRDYFRTVSFGRFPDSGSVVVDSVWLPKARADYPPTFTRQHVVEDCTAAADDRVYFPDYFGIVVQTNAPRVGSGSTSGTQMTLTLDGVEREYGVAFITSGNQGSLDVYGHEMGHGMRLAHAALLRDGERVQNYSWWDIMGVQAVHLSVAYMDWLGWLPDQRRLALPADSVGIRSLELVRLADPPPTGVMMVEVPVDSLTRYVLEARRQTGLDSRIPEDGVILRQALLYDSTYREYEGYLEASVVAPTAANGARDSLEHESFQPGDQFADSVVGFFFTVDSLTADGYGISVVRGWPVAVMTDGPGTVTGLPGTPTCAVRCRTVFDAPGSSVQLTALPAEGEGFAGWVGDCGGTGTCTVVATNARRVTAVFGAPLTIETTTLPPAVAGEDYETHLAASHVDAHWTIDSVAGPLPPGLVLHPATGTLDGVPTRFGHFTLALASEWKGVAADATLTLLVRRPDVPVATLLDGLFGEAPLQDALRDILDDSGNQNGTFDLGDFRNWMLAEP